MIEANPRITRAGFVGRGESLARTTFEEQQVGCCDVRSRGDRNGCRGRCLGIGRFGNYADDSCHGRLRSCSPVQQRQGQVPDQRCDRRPGPEARLRCGRLLRLASPPGHHHRGRAVGCRDPHAVGLQLGDLRAGPSGRWRVRREWRRAGASVEHQWSDGLHHVRCSGRQPARIPDRGRSPGLRFVESTFPRPAAVPGFGRAPVGANT
jgi:hypothetical protein